MARWLNICLSGYHIKAQNIIQNSTQITLLTYLPMDSRTICLVKIKILSSKNLIQIKYTSQKNYRKSYSPYLVNPSQLLRAHLLQRNQRLMRIPNHLKLRRKKPKRNQKYPSQRPSQFKRRQPRPRKQLRQLYKRKKKMHPTISSIWGERNRNKLQFNQI